MNSLYYMKIEFLCREYEVEVEYEYEPEELATPASPPSPARALIERVSLMDKKPNGNWVSVDVEKLLDAHQERMIQAEILDYVPRLGLPRPVKMRPVFTIEDARKAA
ncbi:MAG: hypothetical protein MUC53_08320 [Candidatus Contendobacter sp.]|jgi:hypothetical protein|nr:hypothetical protein [Candidatus Contendobacter sp.]